MQIKDKAPTNGELARGTRKGTTHKTNSITSPILDLVGIFDHDSKTAIVALVSEVRHAE